ncbi:hypothetical protein [Spiroplasma endosymbiont of Polydrusus pterygomalis]|uniref:hypothetical protein n=1 Tax=Spiroplasma endosymbiont of Polydrusus pterygomalis TaxID=3139327 RepID=UPI003CCB05FC
MQLFAKTLYSKIISEINDIEIKKTIKILTKYVDKYFFGNDYLQKGIIYLHGQLPDNIKEYLEYKFLKLKNIVYLIANNVILEGVNLPIENIYILNTRGLYQKDLTNLIGRANRLKEIFNGKNNLDKLLPQIHFINTEIYNNKNSKMQSKIKLLHKNMVDDIIENPLLYKFDVLNVTEDKKIKVKKIIENENIILKESKDNIFLLKKKMIELGINNIFNITEELCNSLFEKLKKVNENEINCNNIMDMIYKIFIEHLESYIIDPDFKRLRNIVAINYYQLFLDYSKNNNLKQNVHFLVKYFEKRIADNNSIFYFGNKFGEIIAYEGSSKVYIDLKEKSKKELINLAIVKLKMENDFVSYKLTLFFDFLFEYKKVNIEEYNKLVFGTNDKEKLNLIKLGVNLNIINKLQKDKQLSNIFIDSNNNIKHKIEFEEYKNTVDDFIRFELEKIF